MTSNTPGLSDISFHLILEIIGYCHRVTANMTYQVCMRAEHNMQS